MVEANDIKEQASKSGAKPISGKTVGPGGINGLYQYDENGKVINHPDTYSTANRKPTSANTNPENVRIGDYYYDLGGKLQIVPNSPTDIFKKWGITKDTSLYDKPTKPNTAGAFLPTALSALGGGATSAAAQSLAGAGAASAIGATGGTLIGLLPMLAIGMVATGNATSAEIKKYHEALREWQKSQDRATWDLAGDIVVDNDGNVIFRPDLKKAINMNIAFAGTEVQKAFGKDTNVYFGEDGRLKVDVNPIYAQTDEYKDLISKVSTSYSGLTKDNEKVDEYLDEIKQYIDSGNNQFKFKEVSYYSYKGQIPGASDDIIKDAYTNELGAYMSEEDGATYPVKVYRDGEIKEENAKEVLEHVYNMDKGQRSDYMVSLYSKMDDPDIPDNDKVYILSEIKLLNAADSNEDKYDNGSKDENGGTVKSVNKYFGMLDQDSIISIINNWQIIGGVSITDTINALNHITPWNMYTSKQEGLQEDPAAASAARLISTATSAATSFLLMQGIEYKLVRPLAGLIGKEVTSTALGAKFTNVFEGAKLAAGPLLSTLGYSMSEILYNATSDLIFDIGKLGVRALSGQDVKGEEFLEDFGVDLVMDVIMQYGPMGLAQLQTQADNYRLEIAYEPYKARVEETLEIMDAAELDYNALKAELADMRKGTKKYATTEAELKKKEKAYNKAKKEYDAIYNEAQEAVKAAMPSASEELGAMLAGKVADLEEKKVVMWLRKRLNDDKAGLSVLAEQAYNKTEDVYLYMAAVNKFQSIQSGIKEVTNKMHLDFYVKGTGDAYRDFGNAIATVTKSGKFSRAQIEYMVAKSEYDTWTAYAKGDQDILEKVEKHYLPYIDKVDASERTQLDNILDTMKIYLQKIGQNYIKSGAATKKQISDIEAAALGNGYIPLWGKQDNKLGKFGVFETPLTLRVGKNFDASKGLFDVSTIRNPVESALSYVHNIANNIARNEMASMLRDIASIDGLSVGLVDSGDKTNFQDIIDEAIEKVRVNKIATNKYAISPTKYENGLDKVLSTDENEAAIKGIDSLADKYKKMRRLVELNKNEVDISKKANRLNKIAKLNGEIKADKAKVRADIDTRVRAAGEYFNKTYKKYGITVDIENTLTSAKYTDVIDSKLGSMSADKIISLKDDVARIVNQVAPYLPATKVDSKFVSKQVDDIKKHALNRIKKEHPELSKVEQYKIVDQVGKDFKAQLSGDFRFHNAVMESDDYQGAYKINFMQNGKDASFYIKGKLAKEVAAEMNSKNINDRRAVAEFFKEAANIKRLLTTGIDPTRVIPNLLRDTIRNGAMSGGTDYWFFDKSPFGFQATFTRMAKAAGDSDEDIAKALGVLEAAQSSATSSTYNEAINGDRTQSVKRVVQSSVESGKNRGGRLIWNLLHNKKGALEMPMNWAENFTRNRAGRSAFLRAYMRGAGTLDQETRLSNAYEAGLNAARENTMNFSRRGTFISQIATFVPYLSQNFSSLESAKISFLKDPVGVSSRIFMFGAAYMIELSRVLSRDESRKNYYNLSEYDREHNIVLALDNGDLVTIPLDEALASLIYPWRRGLETMHNVDPENFFKIMVDGFLDISPLDLTGFTEGDSFNFGRGIEKLGAQMLPTFAQAIYSQASGRNMYYGSTVSVSKDDLAEYGNYDPTAGDYTTISKNSQLLRSIANAFGIEQWRLQQVIADLGGNVGQYVVNWMDKLANAPEDAQGGKDFVDATFKSFTGMDSNQVSYNFTAGIEQLQLEKDKVKSRLQSLNKQIDLASGEKLAELQDEAKKVKQEFALKVGNFVDKYINAYEIAGGLTKQQANKIWYLFNFSDDDSIVSSKSVEAYYRGLAKDSAADEATQYASGILDKYYDQTKGIYRGNDGKWHYYSPYGEQAFFNTISGKGMEYQVGLRNILEAKGSSLKREYSDVYDAREAAANAGNWTEYDKLGLAFDEKILNTIKPYVEANGAREVLTESEVLDYLEGWFFVPTSYMKSKYGKNISLAHNASKQRAFKRPYIKQLFGVKTSDYGDEYVSRPERLVRGE